MSNNWLRDLVEESSYKIYLEKKPGMVSGVIELVIAGESPAKIKKWVNGVIGKSITTNLVSHMIDYVNKQIKKQPIMNESFWKELRDRFFKECTGVRYWEHNGEGAHYLKIGMAPHDLFEWFKEAIRASWLQKLLDATPDPEPGMRWVAASDRPPNVTCILAHTGGLVITLTFIDGVYYTGDGNKWCNPVTHWMPRPAPPGSLA